MAELPEELFLAAVRALVTADRDWVPTRDGESLYLRPFMFALEVVPRRAARRGEYLFLLYRLAGRRVLHRRGAGR